MMANSKLERDLPFIESNWSSFMELVKDELSKENKALRELDLKIKKISRLEKILHYSENNINFLINHKVFFAQIDESLVAKFNVLEAFKRRDNLDNDIAIRTFESIINSTSLKREIDELIRVKERSDLSRDYIGRLKDLLSGRVYSFDLITELTSRFNLDSQAKNAIVFYPIMKNAKKKEFIIPKEIEKEKNEQKEVIPTYEPEKMNYRYLFDIQNERYNKYVEDNKDILTKYYKSITSMTPSVSKIYAGYVNLSLDELDNIDEENFGKDYPDVFAKIIAMKIFRLKSDVDNCISDIIANGYDSTIDIELFSSCVDELIAYTKKLTLLDGKLTLEDLKNNINVTNTSNVFFLRDKDGEPFIKNGVYDKGLLTAFNNASEGLLARKTGQGVKRMFGVEAREKDINKTIFMVKYNKSIISYIKVNMDKENGEGICIITSSLVNPNTIVKDTASAIKDNLDSVLTEIASIEGLDPKELEIQESIRNNILSSFSKEGELNGKAK